MINSIHSRILFSALVILILFMSLIGLVLDNAFKNNIEKSLHENLRTQIYTLLAIAEFDDTKTVLQLPVQMTEPRLNLYDSTLYARILTVADTLVWQSQSLANISLPFPSKIKMGEFNFSKKTQGDKTYRLMNFTTIWVTNKGEYAYVFQVAEDDDVLNQQITKFRKNLWFWLLGVSLVLVLVQTVILRWGLKPLRQVANDLLAIENGSKTRLTGDYPKEITLLTQNLNQLLDSSQQQLSRYRDSLGNMAHSLKTPLTVLQGIMSASNNVEKNLATEQLNTINNIVDFQLKRAATVGKSQLVNPIVLNLLAEKIVNTLKKVYADKNIKVDTQIPIKSLVMMDEGDLYELLGNLLENAFKWCNKLVSIQVTKINQKTLITIEDDGPGIPDNEKERILLRGQRADMNTPGHGLGLAMVNEMLLLYEGSMQISNSPLGGAKIIISL